MTRHRPGAEPPGQRPRDPDPGPVLYLVVATGGALGSLARWEVARAWPRTLFPWPTLSVNVAGSLLLGVLFARVAGRYARHFLGVGCLGGFTTFSTYTSDARLLLAGDHPVVAAAYLLVSVLGGLLGAWAGLSVTRRLAGR